MRLRTRIALVVFGSIVAATTVHIAQPHSTAGGAVLLAAGAVLGELLVLRLDDGTGLPLSYSVLIVLVTCFDPLAAVALVVGAELVAVVVRVEPRPLLFARVGRHPTGAGRGGRPGYLPRRPARIRGQSAPRRGARRTGGHGGRGAGRRRVAPAGRTFAQRARGARHRRVDRAGIVRRADVDRLRRCQRPRRARRVGSVAVRDPAARHLVLVRAPRLDQPYLPADDRVTGDGSRVGRCRARGPRDARRCARVGHRARAQPRRHQPAQPRDRGPVAPPRAGDARRAGSGRASRHARGRVGDGGAVARDRAVARRGRDRRG